jgi:putative hemolysin
MNAKIKIASIALVLSLLVLSACATKTPQQAPAAATPDTKIANPATASCELKGYRSQIRTTADGSQYGVCIFPDGSECEEWAFYRGECIPVPEKPTSGTDSSQITNPASVNCLQKGGRLEIRTTANGSQYGVCIFSDGSECEEWAYLRDECAPASEKPPMGTDNSQIANPASAYCEEKDGKVDIRTAEDGSQGGVCVFPDGSECEEWAFYRGECTPGSNIPSK